jgi:hypothetical protein
MRRRIEELKAEIRLDEHTYRTLLEIAGEIVQRVHRHGFAAVGHRPCRANFGHELVFSLSDCSFAQMFS